MIATELTLPLPDLSNAGMARTATEPQQRLWDAPHFDWLAFDAVSQLPRLERAGLLYDERQLGDLLLSNKFTIVGAGNNAGALWRVFDPVSAWELASAGQRATDMDSGYSWQARQLSPHHAILCVRKGNQWGYLTIVDDVLPATLPQDAAALESWGRKLAAETNNAGLPLGIRLSRGNIAQNWLLADSGAPTIKGIPAGALHHAYNAVKGGRMEALLLGTIPDAQSYDTNSSYGAILASLPSCLPPLCHWIESTTPVQGAAYAFLRLRVKVPIMPLSPMGFRLPENLAHNDAWLIFPTGEAEIWAALPDYQLLMETGCKVEILSGWWGIVRHHVRPFTKLVNRIYQTRLLAKNPDPLLDTSGLYKSVTAAIVGKMAAVYDGKAGGCWNPVYFATVTAQARADLFRQAQSASGNVVALTIDGLITTGSLTTSPNPGLGDWRMDGQRGQATVITDYYKDRAGEHRWRDVAALSAGASAFSLRHDVYPTLRSMGFPPGHEWQAELAWLRLGLPRQVSQTISPGSSIRAMTAVPVREYLTGAITTKSININKGLKQCEHKLRPLRDYQRNCANG